MSLSGFNKNVTTSIPLTPNALVKGNGNQELTTTGILCDSSNNLTNVNSIKSDSSSDLTINSSANKNIIIDSLGTGSIKLNTLTASGPLVLGVDSSSSSTANIL